MLTASSRRSLIVALRVADVAGVALRTRAHRRSPLGIAPGKRFRRPHRLRTESEDALQLGLNSDGETESKAFMIWWSSCSVFL